VQTAKKILKNEKNISEFDEDLTVIQYFLLTIIRKDATIEDVLEFRDTSLGKEFLEDAQKHGLIKKRD